MEKIVTMFGFSMVCLFGFLTFCIYNTFIWGSIIGLVITIFGMYFDDEP